MRNEELIKALRTCADHNAVGDKCYGECPYNGNYNECVDQMILDAADALEAAAKRIAELEARLPKDGEWIESNTRPRSAQFCCSVCHRTCYDIQPTRDKAWTKRCRYHYCPNCGARMKGEQE